MSPFQYMWRWPVFFYFYSSSFFSFYSSFCFILFALFRMLTSFWLIILTVFLFTFIFYQRYVYLFYYNNTLLQPVLCSVGWHKLLGIIYSLFGLLNIDISVCPCCLIYVISKQFIISLFCHCEFWFKAYIIEILQHIFDIRFCVLVHD